jgi:AAA family ATP:ADP antiporter
VTAIVLMPALSVAGFLIFGLAPTVAVFVVFMVLRRAGEFAVARPTREVLFIVLPREDKYKAKNFIDTFIYRAGDQVGAWSYAAMSWLGLGMAAISWIAAPLSLGWLLIGLWLGRKHERMAADPRQRSPGR